MAYLEVLTRTFGQRPKLLARNQEMLAKLNSPDWTQRIIVDDPPHGVAWANKNLGTIEATGEWVWVLDDDDLCCYADLIADLREIVKAQRPDVVAVRVLHGRFGMLPPEEGWGQRPVLGKIGPSNVIVRRDIWQRYQTGWSETYAGDFWFVNGLWDAGVKWGWLPVIAAYQPLQMIGAAENAS